MADEPRRKPRQRASAGPTPEPVSETAPAGLAGEAPIRRTTGRPRRARGRESTILGLGERARAQFEEQRPILPLPDPFFVMLPELRQALLNKPLDTSLRELAEGVATALAPAVVQVWIADPAPWANEQARIGGQELIPMLRPRAMGRAVTRAYAEPGSSTPETTDSPASCALPRLPMRSDPLIEEVVATRRPVLLFAADTHPLAAEWRLLVPVATPSDEPREGMDAEPGIGTLAAYPLRARGQFLGVLLLGAAARLPARHLAALEELADLCALAADRDRLLSYSRSQEALAQTVVRHAPVAVAVLTGPDHIFALANSTFSLLLNLNGEAQLIGQPLREVVPGRSASLAASLRLDAVYEGGETQAMIELPIHTVDRGMTYWNVTSTPLPGFSTSIGGVLVAAVDVSRQVLTRQRAQEVAEVAQERIGQMMTLHATSLAVASQLGADPRELLADILRRSISLLEARAGVVYVRDARHGDLEVTVCQGLRGDYLGSRLRVGEGLAGRVAATGQGTIVGDYRTFPFQPGMYADEELNAVIAAPLIAHGQVVGVLDVLDDANRRAFSDDDLWLLELFAAQAAQAIENARTFVQLEHAYRKQRELDRMKDDFIATASHELRTPLTGIQGFLDLLLDYPGSRDEETALDFLARASDSAQELAEISERLLQTSRLDTGRIELHLGPVRLATVVEAALRPFRELQQAQGVTHELAMEVSPEIYVRADLGRLKEVLDNLVSNAIKY
ncbi:MAG: GAF domain-containing protein, partial [Ktedonobacterales bacterium]